MRAVVKYQDNFHYMKFQPGDGTIYTVLWGDTDNDNMYIALGSGDYIQGGYYFRRSSAVELAQEMANWIVNEIASLPQFTQDYHLFDYQATKFYALAGRRKAEWTLAVIVLFSVVIALGRPTNEQDLNFIGHVYRNDGQAVLDTFERWGLFVE